MSDEMDQAGGETRAGEAPAVIHLPDLSQPPPVKKRGRHFGPRPAKDPRDARFDVRCTPAFRAKLLTEARAAGLSLSAYVCAKLGDSPGPRTRRNPGPDMVLLAKVLGQLGKTGSNLNQIAHRLNEYDFEGVTELLAMRAEHEAALAEHRIVYNAILAALGV